jgi:hypothetical protein
MPAVVARSPFQLKIHLKKIRPIRRSCLVNWFIIVLDQWRTNYDRMKKLTGCIAVKIRYPDFETPRGKPA